MKSVVGPIVAAVLFALVGAAFTLAGRTETRLADVHKQLATLHYAEAEAQGGEVEQSLDLERRVPVMGRAAESDVRDARANAGYWRADYAAIAPQKDPSGVVTEKDPSILLLSANAAFRGSQAATDRNETVRRLDNVVKSYGEVLRAEASGCDSSPRDCDARATAAPYNYEYAIRAREALARARPAAKVNARVQAEAAEEQDLP